VGLRLVLKVFDVVSGSADGLTCSFALETEDRDRNSTHTDIGLVRREGSSSLAIQDKGLKSYLFKKELNRTTMTGLRLVLKIFDVISDCGNVRTCSFALEAKDLDRNSTCSL